jgi:DNA-directed RNA polymerase specialized sigma24 family protein
MAVAQDRPYIGDADPAEQVATVLLAKRPLLLRAYRGRLPHEDLEDCLAQAALELVARARARGLDNELHIANALEQKFASRVIDRQRSIARRGPVTPLIADTGQGEEGELDLAISAQYGEPSEAATQRSELRRIREVAAELTDDQRLVLACQVSLGMDSTEFCDRFGWSPEKFRKVAQRARGRLRALLGEYERGERCRRLESSVLAYAAHAASAAQTEAVREHLANCGGCAAMVRDLRIASGRVAGLLPIPVLAKAGLGVKLAVATKLAALWRAVTEPIARLPQGVGSGADSGGGAIKAGIAMVCVASVAGGGQWAARKIARPGRPGSYAARLTASSGGAPQARPVAVMTDPAIRPALLLKRPATPAAVTRGKPRRSSVRSRHATVRPSEGSAAPVPPPASPAQRTAVVPRPAPAPSLTPAPKAPPAPRGSAEFGVE